MTSVLVGSTAEGDMAAAFHVKRAETVGEIIGAAHLFDSTPTESWSREFLGRAGHHLLIAYSVDEAVGFVSGMEVMHPDKDTEMLLYELAVHESHRRMGIGRGLVRALADLAGSRSCRGMWVPVDAGDDPAIATYRSAGAEGPEEAAILAWDFHQPRTRSELHQS